MFSAGSAMQMVSKETIKTPEIKRKDLVLCFIRDTTKPGEYFIRITMPNTNSSNSMASIHDASAGGEVKWIPALDVANIEPTKDSLGFCIHIKKGVDINKFDKDPTF